MAKQRRTDINIVYKVDTASIERANQLLGRASKTTDDFRKDLDKSKKSANDAGKAFKQAGNEGAEAFKSLNTLIKAVSFAYITSELLSFTKQVISIRGEFQKFEAVLTNALGSRSAALIALADINDFAKTTPFSVRELTESFIKLANRGVTPTITQMRAIGDLSATLGKDFIQVVEAILDINNPERWKEIGIRAETVGEKVRLSFRGVTHEVDRTVDGVTNAIVALGQMNKVSGSTEAISRTLSGQVSNLGDAWDQLLNTIGQGNEGVLSRAIMLLSQGIELANKALKSSKQLFQEQQSAILAAEVENFKSFATTFKTLDEALAAYNVRIDENLARIDKESKAQKELANQQVTFIDRINGAAGAIEREKSAASDKLKLLNDERDIYKNDVIPAIREYINVLKEKENVDKEQERIKRLQKEAEASKKLGEDVNAYLAYLSDQELYNTNQILADKKAQRDRDAEDEKKRVNESEELNKTAAENTRKHWKKSYEKRKEDADKAAEQERERLLAFEQASLSVARALSDFAFSARESEMSMIQEKYDRELQLAEDNEQARRIIETRRDQDLRLAAQREKEAYKDQALKKILAETAINVVEAYPDPYRMAAAVIIGGIQAANVRKLKKGEIDIKGPGTKTSDSIPAMLSRGESVMTADETASSKGIFRAVRAKKLNDKVLKEIVAGRSGGATTQLFDDSKLLKKLDEVKNATPDIVKRGSLIYETRKKSDNYRQWVRAKYIYK